MGLRPTETTIHLALNRKTLKINSPFIVLKFGTAKKLDTTLLYIQIEQALYSETNDDFIVKVARTLQQIKALLESRL